MTIEKSEILAAISAVHVTEYPLGMVLADKVLNGIADALLPLLTDTASYRAGAEDMRERAAKVARERYSGKGWHSAAINAGLGIESAIRSLPLPDPQPTPTQESA